MATAFDHEESLTPEEILLRFKKILGRDMTPAEKDAFSCHVIFRSSQIPRNTEGSGSVLIVGHYQGSIELEVPLPAPIYFGSLF
jgi:hypothetical protein